jgi:hypothetical protein
MLPVQFHQAQQQSTRLQIGTVAARHVVEEPALQPKRRRDQAHRRARDPGHRLVAGLHVAAEARRVALGRPSIGGKKNGAQAL